MRETTFSNVNHLCCCLLQMSCQWSAPLAGVKSRLLLPDPVHMLQQSQLLKHLQVICRIRWHLGSALSAQSCIEMQASQWVDEVKAKTPQLSVVLYHGGGRAERYPPTMLASMDVVVSTYDVLVSEKNVTPEGPLFRVQWHRWVLHGRLLAVFCHS